MPVSNPIDNSTDMFRHKVNMRLKALTFLDKEPRILETHGGDGNLFKHCYSKYTGVVIEKNPEKAERLAEQRDIGWIILEGDCNKILKNGALSWMSFNVIDIDPWGNPYKTIDLFCNTVLRTAGGYTKILLAITDGLFQQAKIGVAWKREHLKKYVIKYGNEHIFKRYIEKVGYKISKWYFTANKKKSCAYYACLITAV